MTGRRHGRPRGGRAAMMLIATLDPAEARELPTVKNVRGVAVSAMRTVYPSPDEAGSATITVRWDPDAGRAGRYVLDCHNTGEVYDMGRPLFDEGTGAGLLDIGDDDEPSTAKIIGMIAGKVDLLWPHIRRLRFRDGRWITSTVDGSVWFEWADILRVAAAADLEPGPPHERDRPDGNTLDRLLLRAVKGGKVGPVAGDTGVHRALVVCLQCGGEWSIDIDADPDTSRPYPGQSFSGEACPDEEYGCAGGECVAVEVEDIRHPPRLNVSPPRAGGGS